MRGVSKRSDGMTYDLLIKNGRIIDGSGRPAFHGDVAVAGGKIVELGRLSGSARQTIEADGRAVAPGFVDNQDRKSTRLNSSHLVISYAVFCLKKKKKTHNIENA